MTTNLVEPDDTLEDVARLLDIYAVTWTGSHAQHNGVFAYMLDRRTNLLVVGHGPDNIAAMNNAFIGVMAVRVGRVSQAEA